MLGFMESRASMTPMKDRKIGIEDASPYNNHQKRKQSNYLGISSVIINPWSCGHHQLNSAGRVVY